MPVTFNYVPGETPPAPYVLVAVARADGSVVASEVPAKVDTGADRTIIPTRLAEQLGLEALERREFEGLGGQRVTLTLFRVPVTIRRCPTVIITAAGSDGEPYTLLGRDVLNLFRITFDGPDQAAEFH